MRILGFCVAILICLCFASCKKNTTEQIENLARDTNRKIIMERGAFHNDTFEVEDTLVKFVPGDTGLIEEFPQYTKLSETTISKEAADQLFKQIIEQGFFELNDTYTNMTTDNSMLQITVNYNGRSKTVYSDDFERGCPEVMQFIESEIVRLHGKNLKRQLLPG